MERGHVSAWGAQVPERGRERKKERKREGEILCYPEVITRSFVLG